MYNNFCCFLCLENIFLLHNDIGLSFSHAVVYEDENVFVVPDISPLCVGHFLIVCKDHLNSFGNANNAVFASVKSAKRYLMDEVYKTKDVLFFEHGAVIEHNAGSCIDHAHIHVLPAQEVHIGIDDIDAYIAESMFVTTQKIAADETTLQNMAASRQPYLYYALHEQAWAYPVFRLPSQFFRALIAKYIKTEYNWKLTYKTNRSKELYNKTICLAMNLQES